MRILIADDEGPARGELRELLSDLVQNAEFTEAASGTEALETISRQEFDVLFVDINLGDIMGTTVASAARKLQPEAAVVFATAYTEYAVKAYEIGAMDYILKPFEPERIAQTLERLRSRIQPNTVQLSSNKLALTVEKKIVVFPVEEIVYIETHNRGSLLHTTTEDIETTFSIGNLEQRLMGHSFFRIHKSFLVNLEYIASISLWQNGSYIMKMKGYEKEFLPIGRSQFKVLKTMFQL